MNVTEADLFRSYALDSITLNATLAALDERSTRLHREWARLLDEPASRDRDFALDANADAIRATERARLAFARSLPDEPVDAIDAYKSWTEGERREAYGR